MFLADATKPIVRVLVVHIVVVRVGTRAIASKHGIVGVVGIRSGSPLIPVRNHCVSIYRNFSGSPKKFLALNLKELNTWLSQVRNAAHNKIPFFRQPWVDRLNPLGLL